MGQVHKEKNMDLIAYWQKFVAPYIRARFGQDEKGASLIVARFALGFPAAHGER